MRQMDYGLLMRRVMAQLAVVAQGATQQFSPTPKEKSNASRLLSGPSVVYASECQHCHCPRDRGRRCVACGTPIDVVYASPYWLQDEWHGANERRKVELLRIALGTLRLARVRVKAKYDSEGRSHTLPEDARLAVGREAIQAGAAKVAMHYGYTTDHIRRLRKEAERALKREQEGRERLRYQGTLQERIAIAATPGSSYEVAAELENVSPQTVRNWRAQLTDELDIYA